MIVAKILILCPAKLEPKSNVKDLPDGEPPNVNIESPSWFDPVKLIKSPTAPVPPEPVVIIETEKSFSVRLVNVSFVPAEMVASPFDPNVVAKCLLTLKFVSLAPELAVVFNVLTFS